MLKRSELSRAYTTASKFFTQLMPIQDGPLVFAVEGEAHWDAVAAWIIAFTGGRATSVTITDAEGNVLAHRVTSGSKERH